MEIQLQAFAERVLFGTTLDDKLEFPREKIVDTNPRLAVKIPRGLPRPPHLKLRGDQDRVAAPGGAKLIDPKERGRLLHFFCNHELLATELMALALLKFPDAPASFRQGVLETLKEEQIHTRLYLKRMQECGVEFGELPLSDYFWKSVSTMEDPLDYVTRLSLTFEQANLDYSREYAAHFEKVGDDKTAAILGKIYRDEIGHVGFGLKWFRKWKASGKSDWEAFREQLVFPLSPARAKGNQFNRAGRRKAGLDDKFIDDLKVYQQSRGRTPAVFWFNPEAEHFAARNSADKNPEIPSVAQRDLEFLPAYLTRKDDLLIVTQPPSQAFLAGLQEMGIQLPEIMDHGSPRRAPPIKRKLSSIRPWAWTPDSLLFFKDTLASLTRSVEPDTLWNDRLRKLFSKSWSSKWGRSFEKENARDGWNASGQVYGVDAHSLAEVTALRDDLDSKGYPDLALKAPFGTAAGANRCLMADEEISDELKRWMETVLAEQGSVVVEPWLNRVYDFSVQFEMSEQGLKLLAYTRLVNNQRGQFRGIVTQGFCKDADDELTRFLLQQSSGRPRVYGWYEKHLAPRLEKALKDIGYLGPLGIDALVYRNRRQELRLKSIVEINPRFTMGRVAHELAAHMVPGVLGLFQIVSKKQVQNAFGQNLIEYAEHLKQNHLVELRGSEHPQIVDGSIALTDPAVANRFLALYHVRKRMEDLQLLLNQF